jgi:membrane-associated phospholipid phosphatase
MRTAEYIVAGYLLYLSMVSWVQPLPGVRRLIVFAVTVFDVTAIWWIARATGVWFVIRDWQPAAQILIAYWLSGLFFRAPMLGVEAWLSRGDRRLFSRLHLNAAIAHGPRWVLELLEGAYLSVYLVLPLGFLIALAIDPDLDVDRYWRTVTFAEIACYGVLPWVQTRPPRALDDQMTIANRSLTLRRLNDLILTRGSIQVNTFPSGHAAGALATALAVGHVSPIAGIVFVIVAFGIVCGSVVGRYHYAADSIAGLIVALASWLLLA